MFGVWHGMYSPGMGEAGLLQSQILRGGIFQANFGGCRRIGFRQSFRKREQSRRSQTKTGQQPDDMQA